MERFPGTENWRATGRQAVETRSKPATEAANLQQRLRNETGVGPDEWKHSSWKNLSRAERWPANCSSRQIRRHRDRAFPCPRHGNTTANSNWQNPTPERGP